jgi:peptide/nickel transport system ATP-binding protein
MSKLDGMADRMNITDEILRIEKLEKYFTRDDSLIRRLRPDKEVKKVRAVNGVNLSVRDGEIFGLVGESGCGKSTLARTTLMLLQPTKGHVYYQGEDITQYTDKQLREFRGDVQMIFQDPFASLNPRYTIRQTLTEPLNIHDIRTSKTERNRRSAELLERVNLSDEHLDRYPHEFSGGQRQRIAIARALAVEPKLIVADEPTSALDVSVQAQILNLLENLAEEMELSMLFISHDLSVIRRICNRVAVMYLGKIVEQAPTKKLFTDPQHPYSQSLLSSIPIPDPTIQREHIQIKGDVPTPIDPPSGCQFHPRCPKVIPPEDWSGDQLGFQRCLQLKKRIMDGTVQPSTMREQLTARRDEQVSDEEIINILYNEHISKHEDEDSKPIQLCSDTQEEIRDVLARFVREDNIGAVPFDDLFSTVCETDVPRNLEIESDHTVDCHLYDPGKPGSPDIEREANMTANSDNANND